VIKNKVFVEVRLGKYIVEILMLVANINDSCILEIDFLKKIHLEDIFKPIFSEQKEIKYGLESSLDVLSNLKYLFEESSKNLNKS